MKVELKNYIDPRTKFIAGSDLGYAVFKQLPILEMIRAGETIEVVVPRRIASINPSFLEAFLRPVVAEGMQNKVTFKFLGTNFQYRVNQAIDSVIHDSELLDKGFYYMCESFQGYFVCFADSIKQARKACMLEYGYIKSVRRALFDEVEEYCRQKSIDSMWSWSRIVSKNGKEANRRFQLRA